jgi:HEAT repeat protein
MVRDLLSRLAGGDRRSLGHADEVAATVMKNPRTFGALMSGLWDADPVVRMRAADAAEKVTRTKRELLRKYKKELLGLMAEETQIEARWHLALMVPRLDLNAKEKETAASLLRRYLEDRSAIVRTHALQGLADLAETDASMRPEVIELLCEAARTGTAAMKARSRKLLLKLERKRENESGPRGRRESGR